MSVPRPLVMSLTLLLVACGTAADPAKDDGTDPSDGVVDTDASETDPTEGTGDTGPGGTTDPGDALVFAPPTDTTHAGMSTADVCGDCHSASSGSDVLRDASGASVGPFELWQATMMANAARDPFWHAMVAAESAAHPTMAGVLEDLCATCHAPAGREAAVQDGAAGMALADLSGDDAVAHLGLDGVTCTSCHRIAADGLGTDASFTGGYTFGAAGTIFGPYSDPFANPMQMHAGYTPTGGDHMQDSALCATCHTVITEPDSHGGPPTGHSYIEQSPYLEWRNSSFTTEGTPGPEAASCQDCHMPDTEPDGSPITTAIARRPSGDAFPPVSERSPVSKHTFVGANVLVPQMLRDHRDDLQPRASDAAFDEHLAATHAYLAEHAHLAVDAAALDGTSLTAALTITHDAGHKLPTGFPSRRVWVAVTVTDATGAEVFRMGAVDDAGRIVDGAGQVLAMEEASGPVPGHVDVVSSDTEVPIYRQVMADPDGAPAWRLLDAAFPYVDTRLLPRGHSTTHAEADRTAPVGTDGDDDFVAGGDTVHLALTLPDGVATPVTLSASLLYQPLGARFAAELFAYDDLPKVAAFRAMWDGADTSPAVLAEASTTPP